MDAGALVTADQFNRIQPNTYHASCSSDLVGSVTATAITGASITLTTETDGAVWTAVANFDFDTAGSGTTTAGEGLLFVDGVEAGGKALFQVGAATANDRGTVGQNWMGTLATAGSHTLALRGTLPANMEINAGHTRLTVTVFEVV